MKNDSRIILTSIGFSNPKILDYLISVCPPLKTKSVAVLVTASRGKSLHQFAQLAYRQLKDAGYTDVSYFDFDEDIKKIQNFDLIYVCGGNTFYLNTSMHKNGYADQIRDHILNGCCYVGVSAGTCILSNSLTVLNTIGMDLCSDEDKKYPALGLLPFSIVPHANILSAEQKKKIGPEAVLLYDHDALVFRANKSKGMIELMQKISLNST